MTSAVVMPSLVEEMGDGVIGRWLKREGERVERDEELVEIETDKVTMAYPAPGSGYLQIVAAEGTTVAVGDLIARLASDPPGGEPRPAEPPVAQPAAAEADSWSAPPADGERVPAGGNGAGPGAGVTRATPLARQLASSHGLELAGLEGSGPGGRVTRGDVAARLGLPAPDAPATRAPAPGAPAPTGPAPAPGEEPPESERVDLSRLQQTVARRMSESHASVPAFQVETEVELDRLLALRAELRALEDGLPLPSLNDFVVRACALALREHPRVNGSYRDGSFLLHRRVAVGVAVAAGDALLVPVIADADRRSLAEIAAESSRLAERVRGGTIAPAELAGATFTVSNLGMFGMTAITPIVDAPQAAILGVGAARETVALRDGAPVARSLMTLRLSADHRILYGLDAALFLARVRELLEAPLALMR